MFKGAPGCGSTGNGTVLQTSKSSKQKEGEKSSRKRERGEWGGVGKQPRWDSHPTSWQHRDLGKPEGAHL